MREAAQATKLPIAKGAHNAPRGVNRNRRLMSTTETNMNLRFQESEPWLKARICPMALAQNKEFSNRTAQYIASNGYDKFKHFAEERMAEVDAMAPEWRAFVHEHGLKKARRAMKEFGKRGVKRATVLTGLNLGSLDL